jgi:hypothetical protein
VSRVAQEPQKLGPFRQALPPALRKAAAGPFRRALPPAHLRRQVLPELKRIPLQRRARRPPEVGRILTVRSITWKVRAIGERSAKPSTAASEAVRAPGERARRTYSRPS